ncbi:MAG: transposase [Ignavibacteriaceae bacterium]|nr:transposase [Ignavibacteriaceae bacterium]
MKRIIREKEHRLDPEIYRGEIIVSFTLCVKDRKELFNQSEIFNTFESQLIIELKKYECDSYIYLFMPDHVHLLLSGKNHNFDIKKCLDRFKQKTGYWLYNQLPEYKWQKDYYDHILRKDEDLIVQTKYILNNPVRAGIVDYWKKYKMKGSTVYNLAEWD